MPRLPAIGALVLSAVLVMLAATLWWADRSVLDEGSFTEAAVAALESPQGRQDVAREVWMQLSDQIPPLRFVDAGFAEEVLAGFLDRPAAAPLFERTAESAFASLTSPAPGPVTFDLGGDYPDVLGSLLGIEPEIVDRLVDLSGLEPVVLVEEGQLPNLFWVQEHAMSGLAVLVVSSIVLGMAGLRMAGRRTWVVAVVGCSLAAAGVLEVVLAPLARSRLLAPVEDPEVASIVSGIYGRLEPALLGQARVFVYAGLGLVVVNIVVVMGYRVRARSVGTG